MPELWELGEPSPWGVELRPGAEAPGEEPRRREGCGGGSLQSPATWEGPARGWDVVRCGLKVRGGRQWGRSGGAVDASLVTW